MAYTRVQLGDDTLHHVVRWQVFLDASGPAVCGKSPWPGRWKEALKQPRVPGQVIQVCVTCLHVVQHGNAKKQQGVI